MNRFIPESHFLFGPFFKPDGTEGGSVPADDKDIDEMSVDDAAKTALKKERQARRDAERVRRDAETKLADTNNRLTALEKEKTDREKADREAAEAAATQAGEHQRLAEQYRSERDALQGKLDAAISERDAYKSAVGDTAKEFDSLPEEVRDTYMGGDDDTLAKLAFLPKGKKLAEKLAAAETTATTTEAKPAGTTSDPPANGAVALTPEDDAKVKALQSRRYG